MRAISRLLPFLLLGCGARVVDGGANGDGRITGSDPPDASSAVDSGETPRDSVAADTVPAPADAHIETSLSACDLDVWGPPRSATFTGYEFMHEDADCTTPDCTVFVKLDGVCTMQLARGASSTKATLSAADCQSFTGFLTGDRFLKEIEGTYGCFTSMAHPIETINVATGAVGKGTKVAVDCTNDLVLAHRHCVEQVLGRAFPGATL